MPVTKVDARNELTKDERSPGTASDITYELPLDVHLV